ncbi:MAG: hypothetical protein V8R26_03140 [Clostridia bacterium]|nr:putative uncharacterized protein [Clostridium sp. CAG:452]HJJ03537.1 hypothetical protein [Clostridiaceae bacterium]
MISKKVNSVQEWLPVDEILENGIIKVKNKNYIKILKIIPINFELKSNLEKEAILNSYKIFLKTCNFDIQILIQSNKKDLSNHISKIKEKNKEEKENIKILSEKYTNYIKKINIEKKSSSKNFYILIKEIPEIKKINTNINEKIIFDKLNDKYFCIKECLSRCGNVVIDISDQKNAEKILYSFFNSRKDLLEI